MQRIAVMKITFDHAIPANADKVTNANKPAVPATDRKCDGITLDLYGNSTDSEAYGKPQRAVEDMMQAAGSQDVSLYRNYMTIMSNTMSDEDFSKLMEEGYDPCNTDIETAVTIVDIIKAELMKAGVDIAGYTDNIDMDKLTELCGSRAYATKLLTSFAREDIPVTEENVQQVMDAFSRGKQLLPLTDGTKKYMVLNKLRPGIDNLYMASHAGAADTNFQPQGYFREELPGYYTQKAVGSETKELLEQIDKALSKFGYAVDEESKRQALWLVDKGIPLTKEHLSLLNDIESISFPLDEEQLFQVMAAAIAEGHTPGEGQLNHTKSIFRRAADCYNSYDKQYRSLLQQPETAENRKARLQLEEIRLHMTVEANVRLLQSGFHIDTAPIEDTINALKDLEEQDRESISTNTDTSGLFRQTVTKTREIPYLPATAIGELIAGRQALTVDALYETGKSQQAAYVKAGEAYETMMTVPRPDLGDHIKTAFRNVDALLMEMGQDLTDENRKAVRGLAYNHMELTQDNLLSMKNADRVVQRVVEKMTPSAVLSMIRDGINPLRTPLEELEKYFLTYSDYTEESNQYSRFLYQMEKNNEITEEEKQSFIGVYRLIRQIQKSDGAAVAKLIDAQAQMNFENLLAAIRTGKCKGVNVLVDDGFGTLQEAISKGISIDSQIEASFIRQRAEEIRNIKKVGDETAFLLEQLEEPVTIDNLLAADSIRTDGKKPFQRLLETRNFAGRLLHKGFGEEDFTDKSSLQNSYESFMRECEALAQAASFEDNITSVDVRALQLTCKQLHIETLKGLHNEEYTIPQLIHGDLTAIHLKLVHDSEERGKVTVSVETKEYGKLVGEFEMSTEGVTGLFAGQGEETVEILKNATKLMSQMLTEEGILCNTIQIVNGALKDNEGFADREEVETKSLYKLAGIVIKALINTISQEEYYEN